jgi:hypothetical protein
MIALAISLLWLLIGVVIVALIIWLVLYGLKNVAGIPVPQRAEQAAWFIFLILIVIYALYAVEGGSLHSVLR